MEEGKVPIDVQNEVEGPGRELLWQWNKIHPRGLHSPSNKNFAGIEGIQIILSANSTPGYFFKLYIDDEIIGCLVRQTNLYAQQYIERETT